MNMDKIVEVITATYPKAQIRKAPGGIWRVYVDDEGTYIGSGTTVTEAIRKGGCFIQQAAREADRVHALALNLDTSL